MGRASASARHGETNADYATAMTARQCRGRRGESARALEIYAQSETAFAPRSATSTGM
jgi:hypothetical protein